MHHNGKNSTLTSLSNEFPLTNLIRSPLDLDGQDNKSIPNLMFAFNAGLGSIENSEHTYSSINSLNTDKNENTLDEFRDDDNPTTDDDDEDNLKCKITLSAENYQRGKVKAAHDVILGKSDASLGRKTLTAMEAPHLDTRAFIRELDDVAKTSHLDVSMTLAEQIKGPVFSTV